MTWIGSFVERWSVHGWPVKLYVFVEGETTVTFRGMAKSRPVLGRSDRRTDSSISAVVGAARAPVCGWGVGAR